MPLRGCRPPASVVFRGVGVQAIPDMGYLFAVVSATEAAPPQDRPPA